MKRQIFVLCLLAVAAGAPAAGAELSLRPRVEVQSSIVRLGDLVDAGASPLSPADQPLLELPLMPTPPSGAPQRLTVAQLRDMLAALGVATAPLRFAGADAVLIEAAPVAAAPAPKPAAVAPQLSAEAAEEQIVAAVVHHLRQQSGHDLWEVRLEPNAPLIDQFRKSPAPPTIAGGRTPYAGRQRLTFVWPGDDREFAATAAVERLQIVAFAARTIERGDFVRAADVVLRPTAGQLPAQAIASVDAAVGKEAVQTIRADSVLQATQLRAPIVVRRGERVAVKARAAGVMVRTYATAREDGSLGDLIMVEALTGRERYAARVSGPRELEVFAAGASAEEIAAAAR